MRQKQCQVLSHELAVQPQPFLLDLEHPLPPKDSDMKESSPNVEISCLNPVLSVRDKVGSAWEPESHI